MLFQTKESRGRRGPISRYVTVSLLALLALVLIWYMWKQQFPKDAIAIFEGTPHITSIEIQRMDTKEVITLKGEEMQPLLVDNPVAGMYTLKRADRKKFEKKPVAVIRYYVGSERLYSVDLLQLKEGKKLEERQAKEVYRGHIAYWNKHKQQMSVSPEWYDVLFSYVSKETALHR